jgi:hypothetical protein
MYSKSRDRYSQVKVHHKCHPHRWQIYNWCQLHTGGKFAAGVNYTPVANLSLLLLVVVDTSFKLATGINDTGGKFAANVNDTSGKLPPVSTTLVVNLPSISKTLVANNGNSIRLLTP